MPSGHEALTNQAHNGKLTARLSRFSIHSKQDLPPKIAPRSLT